MRTALTPFALALALLACVSSALAQTPVPASATARPISTVTPVAEPAGTAQPSSGKEQLIERIHVDDGGSRIDEVRYGGETRSISVAPKGGLPVYDVQPVTGARTWKILGF